MRTDAVLAQLVDATRLLAHRLTQLTSLTRGLVLNDVLHSGTRIIPTEGHVALEFQVPMASVVIDTFAAAADVTIAAGPPAARPTHGIGVAHIGPGTYRTYPLTGNVLTVYGTAGDQVYIGVSARPWDPGAGG